MNKPVTFAFFSDGSGAVDPHRYYFVQQGNDGPYVFSNIRTSVETARELLAMNVRIKISRIIESPDRDYDKRRERVVWESPPITPERRPRVMA